VPYIITTLAQCEHPDGSPPEHGRRIQSRRAVATLEEARQHARNEADATVREDEFAPKAAWDAIAALPEAGGTVGPLPDGTVIEVRRVG
jgi:hypothetical protein